MIPTEILVFIYFVQVSWLSRYPDEDERVFAGAYVTIEVVSVRIIETSQNFETVFRALFIFDSIVTDGHFGGFTEIDELKKLELQLIRGLFDLESLNASKIDDYIKNVIRSYIWRKKEIIINMESLKEFAEDLCGFVFVGAVEKQFIETRKDVFVNDAYQMLIFIIMITHKFSITIFQFETIQDFQNLWTWLLQHIHTNQKKLLLYYHFHHIPPSFHHA